jgi:hypothetical protein
MMTFPVAPPGAMMSLSFESEEIILEKLRVRLCRIVKFAKDVRRLAENPFQRQLEMAPEEWQRRNKLRDSTNKWSQGLEVSRARFPFSVMTVGSGSFPGESDSIPM